MASSSCYETIYISHVYSIISMLLERGKQKTKKASKKERVHGFHVLLNALCLAFFQLSLSLVKKIRHNIYITSALVTVAHSSFP